MKRLLLLLVLLTMATPCFAHKPSDSLLRLNITDNTVTGEWAAALRDLQLLAPLDQNGDGQITWGELKASRPALEAELQQDLQLAAPHPCPLTITDLLADEHSDGAYAVLRFTATCDARISRIVLAYNFLFDRDAQHKGLISFQTGDATQSAILSTDKRQASFSTLEPSWWRPLREYIRQGMVHIWLGLDHLLFLIALLLPAGLIGQEKTRREVPFREVLQPVLATITAFTLAHALTLALVMFGLVLTRASLIEALIALTIVLSCIKNLHPVLGKRLWPLAFGFGLIHGMGFALMLGDLGLQHGARWVALIGFNIGVELGQLAVVAWVLPILYTIRHHRLYRLLIVQGLSWIILLFASIWFIQRAFSIVLIPALVY